MWYVAEIVERIRVAGDRRVVTHVNFVLVSAVDAQAAYAAAMKLGREGEMEYRNPKGKRVTIRFAGLRDLNRIHDALEHGGELMFEEYVGARRKLTRRRKDMSAFCPPRPSRGPDYTAGDIIEEVRRLAR